MQNNVTYLSRKLQRSLDNNYNVIDMAAVIEIISTLEKTSVTKELLETTRLGKYINELRRKTSNESLAKRAKELLKKWRDLILPDANGQIRSTSVNSTEPPSSLLEKSTKKRPASSTPPTSAKKFNGTRPDYDFSDNSNCSMTNLKEFKKTDVIFINSDSNSSMPETPGDPTLPPGVHGDTVDQFDTSNDASSTTEQVPKKRGRKKGSKNHKNLVIAAEESFTNKMAVSRNSKVKTTQELLADIQNRKPSTQDIELRTAQLTESLTRIEHKLNPQKVKQKPIIVDDVIVDVKDEDEEEDDEIIVDVVGTEPIQPKEHFEVKETPLFTIENLMKQLPTLDKTVLEGPDEMPNCDCPTPKVSEQPQQQISVEIVANSDIPTSLASFNETSRNSHPDEPEEQIEETERTVYNNCVCAAKIYLNDKYHLDAVDDCKVAALHDKYIPNVNGNTPASGSGSGNTQLSETETECNENIVPNFMSERLHKRPNENFQKYSISIDNCDSDNSSNNSEKFRTETQTETSINAPDLREFREWHETLDVISYNDELLRILPYVIID